MAAKLPIATPIPPILNAPNTGDQDIGALRFWQNRAQRVHDEVNDKDVEEDFQTHPALRSHWKRMLEKEAEF
ncbi:MAG: hypothetical protein EBX41_07135, partial [Chitinophagia bacterium]|nr:hypothetical protein [Chitinophagia bacterium]